MLTIIIIFVVLEGVIYLIDMPFKSKIKNSTSVETSLKTRKQLKIVRGLSTLVLIVLVCIGIIWFSIKYNSLDTMARDLGMVIAYAIIKGWSMLTGNIQTFSKEKYLSKHPSDYVFYLRAFESDFYKKSRKGFMLESVLAKAIKKRGKPISAIGMTKELDAPVGASRIYVSDETWQADVAELMQKARMIFILMSDRESCIWEISNGANMISKICFIIENTEKYENVRKNTLDKIPFPSLNTILEKLGNRISIKDIDEGDSYIGFVMEDNDLEVFDIRTIDSPRKINGTLDKIMQIKKLL